MASRRSYFTLFNRISPLLLCGATLICSQPSAKADEFSLVPASSPIYSQLSSLDKFQDGAIRSSNLTRYEAALQVARVLATATNSPERFSKANWRAIASLIQSLKTELVSLGVNVESARQQAEKSITAKESTKSVTPNLDAAKMGGTLSANSKERIGLNAPLLGTSASTGLRNSNAGSNLINERNAEISISPRLRANATVSTLNRPQNDLFDKAPAASSTLSTSTSLAYDLNSWLTLRAQSAKRNFQGPPDKSPLLSAPLFAGADTASSAGGGVDLNLGGLQVSTDVERFSSDNKALGTKVGGGIGISAWDNRLSLSARLARLIPENRSVEESTATELNMGLGINDRLSLSLLYQSLYTRNNTTSNERVAGGLNLNF